MPRTRTRRRYEDEEPQKVALPLEMRILVWSLLGVLALGLMIGVGAVLWHFTITVPRQRAEARALEEIRGQRKSYLEWRKWFRAIWDTEEIIKLHEILLASAAPENRAERQTNLDKERALLARYQKKIKESVEDSRRRWGKDPGAFEHWPKLPEEPGG